MTMSQGKQRQAHLISVTFDSAPSRQREKVPSALPDRLRRSDHTYVFSCYYTPPQTSGVAQLMSDEARDGHARFHAPAVLRHGTTILRIDTKIMNTGSISYGGCFLGSFDVESKTLHLFKSLTILARERTHLNSFSFCHWECSPIHFFFNISLERKLNS
jgi:hypothetical protein